MLAIRIAKGVEKDLRRLPPKHQRQVAAKIAELRNDPEPHDSQALKGSMKPFRRADSGEYRIIYRVEAEELLIAAVGPRNDDAVYKAFARSQR